MKEKKEARRGMQFPPRIDPASGRFQESEGLGNIKESVYLILMTQKGERFRDPGFGTRVMAWPFSQESGTRRHMMERELAADIRAREPRVREVQVRIEKAPEEPVMRVRVDFTVEEGEEEYVEISL